MPVKIAVVGAQGTGKTTLAKALAGDFNLPLISEGARELSELMGVQSPDQVGVPLAIFLQQAILIRQIILEKNTGGFISDRSTVDCFAYWQKLVGAAADDEVNRTYERMARENARHYQLMVFCPVEFPLSDDSFRYTDVHFQKDIDVLIRTCIERWNLEDKTIFVKGSTEGRLSLVKQRFYKL